MAALEDWSKSATQEFTKLAEKNQRMVDDIMKLGSSLNELHALFKRKTRSRL